MGWTEFKEGFDSRWIGGGLIAVVILGGLGVVLYDALSHPRSSRSAARKPSTVQSLPEKTPLPPDGPDLIPDRPTAATRPGDPVYGVSTKDKRLAEATQLGFVGTELCVYARAHGGAYPNHVGVLLELTETVQPKMFVSPLRIGGDPPAYNPAADPGPIYRFGDFWFVCRGIPLDADNDPILAFGPVHKGLELGRIVLVADPARPEKAYAKYVPIEEFEELIKRQNERRATDWKLPPIQPD